MLIEIPLVSVEKAFPRAVPAGIAVGLGIDAGMVAIRKASGMAITSWFAAGIGCGNDGCSVSRRA